MKHLSDLKTALGIIIIFVSLIFWIAQIHFQVQAHEARLKEFPSADWFQLKFDSIEKKIENLESQ